MTDLIKYASSGVGARDPEARRAKWADPDRTRLSLNDRDYRRLHMKGQKMKLVPFGSRVVVMPPPAAKSGIEGFELGAGSQDRPESGTVVAIGPEVKFIKIGDTVSFTRYDAVDITVEGEVLWIMKEENVAGKFEA